MQLSGWSYVEELGKVGVKISRYTNGLMHQKVMFIDDLFATISTANLDNRSFRLNFEITMAFAESDFALQVRRMLENDFTQSEPVKADELKAKGFWFRFAVRCARLLAPIQ